jgi:hypothetical protein
MTRRSPAIWEHSISSTTLYSSSHRHTFNVYGVACGPRAECSEGVNEKYLRNRISERGKQAHKRLLGLPGYSFPDLEILQFLQYYSL